MKNNEKRILLVYPHNFFERNNGINNMFYYFAKYLKSIGFTIDLFTLKNFESKWEPNYKFDHNIVKNTYFYDFATKNNTDIKKRIINKLVNVIKSNKINNPSNIIQNLPDNSTPMMKQQFKEILKKNKYSYILVGYAYWANLIKDIDLGKTIKVISVNDWLTIQMKDYYNGKVNITNFLKDEIERINMFDIAIEISTFEHQMFSQLAPNPKHFLVPIFMETKKIIKNSKPKYDITFIAHKNIYNIEGIKWFIKEVLPLIPDINLLIVGKVNTEIGKINNKKITQIEYIEDLDNVYKNTKTIICPLHGGTGLKVKIIEALSYGVPVVCTSESMVGFPIESNNGIIIEDEPKEFAKQITKLTSNYSFLKKQSKDGKKYFEKYFSTKAVDTKLDKIFHK